MDKSSPQTDVILSSQMYEDLLMAYKHIGSQEISTFIRMLTRSDKAWRNNDAIVKLLAMIPKRSIKILLELLITTFASRDICELEVYDRFAYSSTNPFYYNIDLVTYVVKTFMYVNSMKYANSVEYCIMHLSAMVPTNAVVVAIISRAHQIVSNDLWPTVTMSGMYRLKTEWSAYGVDMICLIRVAIPPADIRMYYPIIFSVDIKLAADICNLHNNEDVVSKELECERAIKKK